MKKHIYGRPGIILILIMMLMLCSCDNGTDVSAAGASVSQQSVSEDGSVSEDSVSVTPTAKPTATPTPSVSKDAAVSTDNALSADAAVSTDAAVSADKATPTPLPTPDPAMITAFDPVTMYVHAQVNVRKGPGTEYEKVGLLNPGETLSATGRYGDKWIRVEYKGEICYVSAEFISSEPPATPTPVPAQPPAQDVQPTPTPAPIAPPPQVVAPAGVLMIGDSRCVQMRDVTGGGGVSWICENSKGYEWFVSTALGQADAIIGRGTKVVICLGVNDTDNAYSYAPLINQKAAEWAGRGAKTYFVSVNPVSDNPYTNMDNVNSFNTAMVNNLAGVKYIDTCSYLINNGYGMVDGLHYDAPTNALIFNLIIGNL